MEPWQKSHIQKHRYDLQRLTICNSSVRAILQGHGVLAENDISQLDATHNLKGIHAESELMYNLLLTRKGAFNALIDACKKTNQTGALCILQQVHLSQFTTWDELSDDLKNEIGNKLVEFQGERLKFSECCHHLHHLIDGKFLKELETGNTPKIVNNQVPDQVKYYIHRTLRSRSKLKSSVFQQPCNDVFVFDGLERYQLTRLAAGAETDVSGNQIEGLNVRFILLEYEGDFKGICELASSPVHLIRYNNVVYEWVQSSGSVKNLQKYVDDDQDCFLEGELASRENKVNVIPDSPGMGKTVLLANVAHQISKEKPNMLIRFLVMKDFVQSVSEGEINLQSVVSLIVEQSSDFECGRNIVQHILTNEPCIIMLDGFDEVLLHQIKTAKEILTTIATLKSAQIYVTTRPHMRDELENTLKVLGYTICPFSESDQAEFLLKFWEMEGATINDHLKKFSTLCVKSISSKMTDFEKEIAGIPLQCKLLAETYRTRAKRCSEVGFSNANSKPIFQIKSIFEMYKRHMKMRLESCKSQVEKIKNVHTYYALELLFREHAHQFQTLKESSFSIHELCSLGFLESTNSHDIRFVHRTFAEYFLAWFAVEMKRSERILPFFLNILLATKSREEIIITPFGEIDLGASFTFNHPVIVYFINSFANAKYTGDPSSRLKMLMDSVYYEQVSRIFVASAVSDYQFMPFAVSFWYDPLRLGEQREKDISELLLVSANHSGVELMKTYCAQRNVINLKTHYKIDSSFLTALHVAVRRGHYGLVEYLTQKSGSELKHLRYLLHFCVFESLRQHGEVIDEKCQIIKLLCKESDVWINEKLSEGTVPLLQKNVHHKLVKCLIECGANVNVLDKNGNTILHKISENPVTPEFYHMLVDSLCKRQFKHFNQLNWKNISPLHCALERVEVLVDTLKLFSLKNTDFNVLDESDESPLFYAIRSGRSVSLITTLIELKADMTKINKECETVLHICAKHGHYFAMKYFLETFQMDVNATDKKGNTPLHSAVIRRSAEYESMQKLLITGGADVNARNREGELHTPFVKALRQGKGLTWDITKLMEKQGLIIKSNEATEALEYLLSNRNIMISEIDKEFVQVLEYLIRKGGEITNAIWESECLKKNMKNVLQATDMSLLWSHLKTSELLTKKELEDCQEPPTDSSNERQWFFETVQIKKGSFERVCILMIASKQMTPLLLLRHSLYLSLLPNWESRMFVTPPVFTNQFIYLSQHSSINCMALITTNPFLTIWRIRDTIRESVVVIKEADISSQLQKFVHEELIVVNVRVVTAQLIIKLEADVAAQCKIIFVCSRVASDVENCQVAVDTLTTWDDISFRYISKNAWFNISHDKDCHMSKFFESPLILSKLSQLRYIVSFPQVRYSIIRFHPGHIDMEFQRKSFLCPTVFHYVLPDKLVFQGISIEKLQEFARFGHKIGYFGEDDVDNLDFVVVKQSYQYDEICRQTSENVHFVEYEQKNGLFQLTKTWGWEENIQWFLKKPLCEGFPHCDCAPYSQNLVVRLLIEIKDMCDFQRFECLLPMNELTLATLTYMKLDSAEELFTIKAIFKHLGGQKEPQQAGFQVNSHSEQLINLVTEHLSTLLIEPELHHVAINTLFPDLAKQTNIINRLEIYQQLKMVKQIENTSLVFVDQTLAWYFIAKLMVASNNTTEFSNIAEDIMLEIFRPLKVTIKQILPNGYYYKRSLSVGVMSSKHFISYEFVNIMCFRFLDALLKQSSDKYHSSIMGFLNIIVDAEPVSYKWIHACVTANLFHLLQLITISFNIESAFESEDIVVLAVKHADVSITQLVVDHFEKETKKKLADIKIYLGSDEISILSLAVLRGHYSLVEYLLNTHGFKYQLQKPFEMEKVGYYCIVDTINKPEYEIDERKRIFDLLLRIDLSLIKHMLLSSPKIHFRLIVHLINHGVDVHANNTMNNNILLRCPEYLTPQEYHEVVKLIHSKAGTSIGRLLKEFGWDGERGFHIAVQHLDLLDETLAVFKETGADFNALNRTKNSVFVHAAKHFRSARVLNALYCLGADIYERGYYNRPASSFLRGNTMALKYLNSRKVTVSDIDEESADNQS